MFTSSHSVSIYLYAYRLYYMNLADIPATLVFDADGALMDYRGYIKIEKNGKLLM